MSPGTATSPPPAVVAPGPAAVQAWVVPEVGDGDGDVDADGDGDDDGDVVDGATRLLLPEEHAATRAQKTPTPTITREERTVFRGVTRRRYEDTGSGKDRPRSGLGKTSGTSRTIGHMSGMGILVVEDDERIGSSLTRALAGHGYEVDWARTGTDALAQVHDSTALVILDLGLPDVDGVDVCRSLRGRTPAPQVLMLTARRDEVDVVIGLDAGADDYIVKPFSLAELLARIRACERRYDTVDRITIGDLEIDVGARQAAKGGVTIELPAKEFDLLLALARKVGQVVRRSELLDTVWDEHWYGSTKTIDTHMWSLRRKLDTPGAASAITTVRGVGYRLEQS
jgi:DNA-binding response OmpR family regulator